ncbi:MAG: DUF4416 family protein [Pirellulales bacterium]
MGDIHEPDAVLLLFALSSRHEAALDWACERMEQHFGPLALVSDAFDFTETEYYATTMGEGLKKQFIACERQIDPGELGRIKRETNAWENEYAALGQHAEPRPLNLDPGYITPAKLVLASTKDHAHRLYLRDGIYAEVTLAYRQRQWQPLEWTYPDYRRADYQEFFTLCREYLLAHRGD